MTQIIKVLIIEDDESENKVLNEFFSDLNKSDENFNFINIFEQDFNEGMKKVKKFQFDILILDWHDEKDNPAGKRILEEVIRDAYIPVIIFSGFLKKNELDEMNIGTNFFLRSVEKKAGGYPKLKTSLVEIANSNLFGFKQNIESTILSFLKHFWRDYCLKWDDSQDRGTEDVLKLMILNRLSFSLSREKFIDNEFYENIKGIAESCYICPAFTSNESIFERCDILKLKKSDGEENDVFIILTPSCDLVERDKKNREGEIVGKEPKVKKVLIAPCINFMKVYNGYNKETSSLTPRDIVKFFDEFKMKRPRYFLLPKTNFIDYSYVDFLDIQLVEYDILKDKEKYEKIANLNYPFAQSLVTRFTSYYNRIGFDELNEVDFKRDMKEIRDKILLEK